MPTGATGQLGLALPVQGELSGTWGDTVNNGLTQYTNIAIAATLTLTNDGAVTLANTTGDATASNITSSLTGAGTVTAQFAIVRVTGTLTTAKVVTAPSYSKTYTVVNAATGGIVTFKASGQTGVSIAVGESAFVYFNGTDYVKLAGTATAGAAAGSNTQVQYNSSGSLAGSANLTFSGTTLTLQNGYYEAYDPADTTSAGYGMRFYTNGGGTKTENGRLVVSQSGTGSALSSMIFQTNSGSSLAEQMRLTSTGLGIGTSSPAYKLDLYTTAQFSGRWANATRAGYFYTDSGGPGIFNTASYGGEGIYLNAGSNYIRFITNSAERMTLDSSGNLLVGTTASNYRLHLNGGGSSGSSSVYAQFTQTDTGTANTDGMAIGLGVGSSPNANFILYENAPMLFFTNSTEKTRISAAGGFSVGTTADPGAGAIYATGNITAYYSDARLKTVSGKIENALDKVAHLSGVYYTNNSVAKSFGYDSDEEQVGVIAQEVEAVLPQIVKAAPFDLDENNNSKSGENYKTVQYDKLVPLLIEAINELQAKVKALEAK